MQSVEVTLQLRRQDTSATIFRTLTICVNLCNLWEVIPSRSFCEFCVICGSHFAAAEARIPPLLSSAPKLSVQICEICGRSSPAEGSVNSVQSVGGHPSKQKQSVGASSQPPFLAPLQTLRVIPCGARRVGRQGRDGADRRRGRI